MDTRTQLDDHGTCDRKGCHEAALYTILSDSGFPQDWYCAAHYAPFVDKALAALGCEKKG